MNQRLEKILDLQSIFKGSRLFCDLNEAQIAKVIPLFKPKEVTTNDRFIEHNTSSAELFLVLTGQVEVHIPLAGKQQTSVVASLGPGESVGEFALLRSARRTASARALEDSILAQVYCADLLRLFEKEPEIGYKTMHNIARVLVERLTDTNIRLQNALEKT